MGSWRKQHGEGHYHWSRSSSCYRKPPLDYGLQSQLWLQNCGLGGLHYCIMTADAAVAEFVPTFLQFQESQRSYNYIWQPTVPRWEKMFCTSVGSVPWHKLVETKKYMYLHDNVMNWDDSAGREAFDNAKMRFWAQINGLPCDIPLPDPNIYIDDIDWDSTVDPELLLDLERDATVPSDGEKDEEVVLLGDSLLLNQSFSCTGWGDDEADTPKHTELVGGAQVNLQENNSGNPWGGQYYAPSHDAKEYEWQNGRNATWGWNQRGHCHSYTQRMGRGAGWNRRTWYGNNRMEENMSWYKAPAYHHSDEYHMNRGRRNYRGRRRGNFAYYHP